MRSSKFFYRNREDSAIGGVASAIAHKIGMPVLVARILFVVSIFIGFGIPLYLVVWFFTPLRLADGELLPATRRVSVLLSIVAVPVLGLIVNEGFGVSELYSMLLAAGAAVGILTLQRSRRAGLPGGYLDELPSVEEDLARAHEPTFSPSTSRKSRPDRVIGGVCAELSGMTGINVTLIRVLVVIGSVIPATFPAIPILYGIALFAFQRRRQHHVQGG